MGAGWVSDKVLQTRRNAPKSIFSGEMKSFDEFSFSAGQKTDAKKRNTLLTANYREDTNEILKC